MKRNIVHHIILASALVVILCIVSAQTVFAAFPTGWNYKKSHVINSAAGAGTDYQVRITAHFVGAGPDSGENVYLNSNCRTDFADVRFVSSDGTTELSYWMETVTVGTSAVFWVKIADNLGTANRTIYVYYGNAAAATTSNGETAFIFFDHFDDVTLAKWVREKELAPGVITIGAGQSYVRCGGGSTSGTYGHTSLGSSPAYSGFTDGAIEVRLKQSANALGEIAYRGNFGANTGYKGRFDCRTGTESPHMRPPYYGWSAFGTAVTRFGIGTNTWYRGTVAVTSSGGTYTHRLFRNNVLMSTATDTVYAGPGEIALQNHYGSYSDYDWVAVRKFVYPEPVHDDWGEEERLQSAIYITKSVRLENDGDADQIITSGDTIRYNVKINNTGNVGAVGASFIDTLPLNVTYAGYLNATSPTVFYDDIPLNRIEWNGDVPAGAQVVITFDVTVDYLPGPAPLPLDTVVSNTGTIHYDSDNDGINDTFLDTDGKPVLPGIQTTDFIIGGPAHGFGTKVAADLNLDGDGILEPGDRVLYTITITNNSGFVPWVPMEFYDTMPANTTYVPGSATVTDFEIPPVWPSPPYYPPPVIYTEHDPVISFADPVLTITGIDIGADPPTDNVVTITFIVELDNPFPAGVTQISNQADVHYDSDGDGIVDMAQSTDGDSGVTGHQPTVTTVSVGMISGTVFDDNGAGGGGGTSGNNTQDGSEPGISSVTVTLYNDLFSILYEITATDINGYYIFTGYPFGNYGVEVTDPDYYTPTVSNSVTITLPPDGTVDFGYQTSGSADLEITKTCAPVILDGTDQLIFVITLTNDGPDTADNVVLTDDLDALAAAGLSNINYYTEDGGVLTPWPGDNTLSWGSMALGASHTIRIYATVAEGFTPLENTAAVVSNIFDPLTGDNTASCTNLFGAEVRRAMMFRPETNSNVTVASSPSLELSANGTIEAWIYPTAFAEDAAILIKGTTSPCYGFGVGGDPGSVFSEGTAQNIGFVLYDNTGVKHLLTADAYALSANKWHHVACTWTGFAPGNIDMKIYINGIQEASDTVTFASGFQTNTEDLIIGFHSLTSNNYVGVIDEVRIWDVARIQSRIQETMCRKITSGESDYANLMGNWRFDAASGPVCNDSSPNYNIGFSNAERICSTAPVGDASAPDYEPGFNPTLSAGDESLTATIDPGSVDVDSGIHVYRVNTAPDYRSGPLQMRLFPDRGYWGVFVTGGAAPRYDVEYKYDVSNNGIPGVGREENLRLAFRHGNCEIWKDLSAELDTGVGVKTLTKEGMTGTEYILGIEMDPRNAIHFISANSNYVSVNDSTTNGDLDPTTYGAIEAWINISSYQDNAGIIHKGDGTNDSYSLYMGTDTGLDENQHVYFTVDSGGGVSTISSTPALNLNTWYHVAGTWDTTIGTMTLYVNGVPETPIATVAAQETDNSLYVGARLTAGPTYSYFNGYIDEVRVWKIINTDNMRNQILIRDTMCRKLAGNEAELGGYWRFDEETGSNSCPDYSGNNHPGIMSNSFGADGSDAIRDARVCSSAPIGDDSDWDYSVGGSGSVSAQVAHPVDGDYMIAEESGGNWTTAFSGIHVYRLDEPPVYPPDLWNTPPYTYVTPNGMTPPAAWSSVDYYRHWGVFVTDWDDTNAPTYDVIYNYLGNPMVPLTADGDPDNPVLGLAKRTDYCVACRLDDPPCPVWVDSGADWDPVPAGVGELRLLGANGKAQSQYGTPPTPPTNPEYILGGINQPLAITLASFTAAISDGCVEIEWETATEIGTIGFYLWRGTQRDGEYEMIPNSYTRSKSVAETMGAEYAYTDCEVDFTSSDRYYYKLEELEAGPTESRHFYGPIGPVSETVGASGNTKDPLPASSSDSKSGCFIGAMMD